MNVSEIIAIYAAVVATIAVVVPFLLLRISRKQRMELDIVPTRVGSRDGGTLRMITLEARNRGDHPVRVVSAYISAGTVDFDFHPGEIRVELVSGESLFGFKIQEPTGVTPTGVPLPEIILPRDAGSRVVTTRIIEAAQMAVARSSMENLDESRKQDFNRRLSEAFDGDIRGGIEISTGEFFRRELGAFDWLSFKKK
ncbi:hypothetical protein [Herbidospora daliensis]|uniref:hypothetical protein n=1 Tax=Herbidospora daliensis TaxID=295585 RepID=UPI0012F8EE79|nr:hypothetical protein [Herbidospora daliensis]